VSTEAFLGVFHALHAILAPYRAEMACLRDDETGFYLDTHHLMKNGKALFFGGCEINKRYVSYHLMPVYVFPDLLDGISQALRRRMQGKSCFNFTSEDADLFAELADLTRAGYARYDAAGHLTPAP